MSKCKIALHKRKHWSLVSLGLGLHRTIDIISLLDCTLRRSRPPSRYLPPRVSVPAVLFFLLLLLSSGAVAAPAAYTPAK